jgi:diketogulonate reductase-like aldo/keto reductase
MYDNERAVGQAIADADVARDDVFLVTKIRRRNLAYEDVLESVAERRDKLATDIDLLLIHASSHTVAIDESISAMNELQNRGVVEHIGVSNFSVSQLQDAIAASDTPILTNQVEYHPFTDQATLLEFCIEHDVMLTAYSPLAEGQVVGNALLEAIGDRYGKTGPQVALRWLLQRELVSAIPKASSPAHMQENADVFDFELTDEEMAQMLDLQDGALTRLRTVLGL